MRARGLKRFVSKGVGNGSEVAPRAGAWIETIPLLIYFAIYPVAPRAGAWIETYMGAKSICEDLMSRPVRARGLKQRVLLIYVYRLLKSRPVRARGLKPFRQHDGIKKIVSRPVRARGLKLV